MIRTFLEGVSFRRAVSYYFKALSMTGTMSKRFTFSIGFYSWYKTEIGWCQIRIKKRVWTDRNIFLTKNSQGVVWRVVMMEEDICPFVGLFLCTSFRQSCSCQSPVWTNYFCNFCKVVERLDCCLPSTHWFLLLNRSCQL